MTAKSMFKFKPENWRPAGGFLAQAYLAEAEADRIDWVSNFCLADADRKKFEETMLGKPYAFGGLVKEIDLAEAELRTLAADCGCESYHGPDMVTGVPYEYGPHRGITVHKTTAVGPSTILADREIAESQESPAYISITINATDIESPEQLRHAIEQAISRNPHPFKKETMKPISVTTQTLINGTPARLYADEALFELIKKSEDEIARLEQIQNRPQALAQVIDKLYEGISDLVKYMNERDGAKEA